MICVLLASDHCPSSSSVVAALAIGVFDTVFAGGAQAMIPRVVDDDQLDVANSRLSVGQTTAGHFIGPAIGGVLFAVNRVVPVRGGQWSAFFASARLLRGLRGRVVPGTRMRPGPRHLCERTCRRDRTSFAAARSCRF